MKFELENNLKAIGTLSPSENNVNRNKRFPVILALSGFFSAGFKAVNANLQFKQIQSVNVDAEYMDVISCIFYTHISICTLVISKSKHNTIIYYIMFTGEKQLDW